MNKELFVALCDHIERSVPEIRFIDFDRGQLSASGERPPVDWPCCLLSIDYTNCRDLAVEVNTQLVMADITLRVAFPQLAKRITTPPQGCATRPCKCSTRWKSYTTPSKAKRWAIRCPHSAVAAPRCRRAAIGSSCST